MRRYSAMTLNSIADMLGRTMGCTVLESRLSHATFALYDSALVENLNDRRRILPSRFHFLVEPVPEQIHGRVLGTLVQSSSDRCFSSTRRRAQGTSKVNVTQDLAMQYIRDASAIERCWRHALASIVGYTPAMACGSRIRDPSFPVSKSFESARLLLDSIYVRG